MLYLYVARQKPDHAVSVRCTSETRPCCVCTLHVRNQTMLCLYVARQKPDHAVFLRCTSETRPFCIFTLHITSTPRGSLRQWLILVLSTDRLVMRTVADPLLFLPFEDSTFIAFSHLTLNSCPFRAHSYFINAEITDEAEMPVVFYYEYHLFISHCL